MPEINPVPFAFSSMKAGLSARAGLQAFRDAGGSIRDATWFKLYAQARQTTAIQVAEVVAPIYRRPIQGEIGVFPSKVATGYVQYANVYVRDRGTGIVSVRPFAVRTQSLLTRHNVMTIALNRITQAANDVVAGYGEQVVGVGYGATYQYQPTELPEE